MDRVDAPALNVRWADETGCSSASESDPMRSPSTSELSTDSDGMMFLKNVVTGEMVPIDQMESPTALWSDSDICSGPNDEIALPNDAIILDVSQLRRGDIVFLTEFSLVSIGQMFLRLITRDLFGSGGSDAVHCLIVVDSGITHASIAHVTNSGACINLISAPDPTEPNQLRSGRVYRLDIGMSGDISREAGREALALVAARVSFGTTKSLSSVFKDAKVGAFLQSRQPSTSTSFQMFCTEFVMTVFQAAVLKLGNTDDPAVMRAIDIDGSACTPMKLESFLRDNCSLYGDWTEEGVCQFQYS